MGALRKSLWTLAALSALSALSAPAAAREPVDVCGPVQRLIAAARDRPAFASVHRRLSTGEAILPGFAARGCRASVGRSVSCIDAWGRASFSDWPDLATCPGVIAVVERPPPPSAPPAWHARNGWNTVFRAGNLRIEQAMSCVPCRGPAPARFIITFDQPRRRAR
jgi:hypothetical protein